ncbi:hypothetical protein I552_1513 [Mycobacterium xenopi 3993]|nr:hypothetical protein I552_1513 [Mycobacterium xenopi 3993]
MQKRTVGRIGMRDTGAEQPQGRRHGDRETPGRSSVHGEMLLPVCRVGSSSAR